MGTRPVQVTSSIVVIARYRGLVPLMWALVAAEHGLRVGIGRRTPIVARQTPPGALSKVLLPASAAGFAWSLFGKGRRSRTRD